MLEINNIYAVSIAAIMTSEESTIFVHQVILVNADTKEEAYGIIMKAAGTVYPPEHKWIFLGCSIMNIKESISVMNKNSTDFLINPADEYTPADLPPTLRYIPDPNKDKDDEWNDVIGD